jgi:hypothetical protein
VWRPPPICTMIRPEWALEGTVTTSPTLVRRSREPGEVRLMRAPGALGNATIIPALRPTPCSSNVPWAETSCGSTLHLDAGTQVAWRIRTVVTCGLAAVLEDVELPAPLVTVGTVVPAGGAVPPAPEAPAAARGMAPNAHSNAAATVTRVSLDCLWANVPVKRNSLRAGRSARLARRRQRLAALPRKPIRGTEVAFVQPQRKPTAEGDGASGLEGSPAGVSGRLKPVGATSFGASEWNSEARY